MNDSITRALSSAGGIRALACSAADLTRQICTLQQASATASIALGRGLSAGALMGALLKQEQRVALKFEGNGPLRKMIIEADSDGAIRACAGNPAAEIEPVNGRWNVAGLLGKAGFLTVSRDMGTGNEPYRGMVQLSSSEIGDDLAYYLTTSEQIPSAVGLGTALDEGGAVGLSGGFLIQKLPGAAETELDEIMANIAGLAPITELLQQGGTSLLLQHIFGNIPYTLLETRDIFFRCGCSHDKVERALLSFGSAELRNMLQTDGAAEVTCEFCKQAYHFDAAALERLAAMITDAAAV